RDVEAFVNQLVEKVLGHVGMDWQFVVVACELRYRAPSSDEGEGRNTGHRKRFQMIAAEKYNRIGFGFIQDFPKLTHGGDTGVEHRRILVRRPDDQLRRMNRAKGGDNLPHVVKSLLIAIKARVYNSKSNLRFTISDLKCRTRPISKCLSRAQ